MGDVNLEIGLNFPDRGPDDTNLVRIEVENASDERGLPYTRLAPLVSAVARVTESDSSPFQREGCETLYTCPYQKAVIYVLTLGILLASHPLERVNFPGRQIPGVVA